VQSSLRKRVLPFALLFFFSILGARSSSAQGTPAITSQPANQTVTAGQPVTFTVVIANGPCRSVWYINGAGQYGSFASTISLTIANTTTAMNGWKVSVNLYGCGTAGTTLGNSQTAILTVNPATAAPAITAQPANATVTAGQTATFGVVASGAAPLNYQWLKNGANIAGAMSASYTTPATTTADSGSVFQAVVGNSAGSATSSGATLTVNPSNVAPTITAQPSNQTVTVGQTATLAVGAGGTAPLSYQWHKNGAMIGGATSPSYTTPATTSADDGSTFQVAVGNSAGSVVSTAATMTVNQATGAPSIAQQPQSQTVQPGQSATFTVVIANGPCRSIWYLNGAGSYGSFASTISYTIPNVTLAMNGSKVFVNLYGCGTTGANLGNSQTAILTVSSAAVAPTITTQPANQTAATGQTATFTVTTSGTAPLSYQWQKNGAPISGASASTYTTPSTTASDNGATFLVVASNSVGSATSNPASLTVTTDSTPPTVSMTSPTSGSTVSGTTTLTASASDNIGVANLQFQVDGNNVGTADTTSPYSFSLNTATLSNASHDLTAVAMDASGNHATSIAVPITVSNQAGSGGVPTYALNGAACSINDTPGSGSIDSVFTYTCPLPNPTSAGNLLVVMVRWQNNSLPTVSFTDEPGNTYTRATTCTDAPAGTVTGLYYVENTKAGARNITVHFSSSSGGIAMGEYEFYNVAQSGSLDQAGCNVGSASTTVTSGVLPALVASGDLVFHYGMIDRAAMITGCTPSSQANIAWTQRTTMILDNQPQCAQYGIYNAAASFSPSFTVNANVNYVSASAAFKASSAGTPPASGIRVNYVQHDNSIIQNLTSALAQMPIIGNLAVIMYTGSDDYPSAISDGSNTWRTVGANQVCNEILSPPQKTAEGQCSSVWYASVSAPGTLKLNVSRQINSQGAGFGDSYITFDISGASANPVDVGFGSSGLASATGQQVINSSGGPVTTLTAAPSAPNEVILVSENQQFDTMTGLSSPSGAYFLSNVYTNESNSSHADLNGGWGLLYNGSSTAGVTWVWTHDTSQSAGINTWTVVGAAFH
jgi:Bacterial Ig domain/Immunoglobulin I-set domain